MAYFRRSATDRKAEAARARQMTEEMAAAMRTNNPAIVRAQAKREQEIPSVSLEDCQYDKVRKVLKLTSNKIGMPGTFFVESHRTGKVVRFTSVLPCDILYDEDGWDGEMQVYRPLGNVPGVDHMIIYNAW
jgi:hypothetical protein